MNCPLCDSTGHIEIDLHSDGYCQDALECGDCGGIWTYTQNELKIIKSRRTEKTKAFSDFICPTCKAVLCIETDLDAFQFHEELQECANCGTVCSSAHNQVEVVLDSQPNSFLNSTSEPVEADDYVFI
jgi:uncharacterized Zn finger protein